ncbi:MAG: 3-methyladenine DNA glycosylase, partial [Proteobacteria bacterium]
FQIATGQRIGISKALEKHWRFGIRAHPSLSKPFPKS